MRTGDNDGSGGSRWSAGDDADGLLEAATAQARSIVAQLRRDWPNDAEDAVQFALAQLMCVSSSHEIDPARVGGWLRTTARRRLLAEHRPDAAAQAWPEPVGRPGEDPAVTVLRNEFWAALGDALALQPERDVDALLRHVLDDEAYTRYRGRDGDHQRRPAHPDLPPLRGGTP